MLRSIGVSAPYVLAIIGNGNHYKNARLLVEALRMSPESFNGVTVVVVGTNTFPIKDIKASIKFLSNVTDAQLGVLYS